MKILLIISSLLFLTPASDTTWVLKAEVSCEQDFFLTDHLGNLYILKDKQIIKYNKKGVKQCDYSNNELGAIDHADVSDPFRILLYYKDFNQVVFLDNEFAEIHDPILLDDLDLGQTEIACGSSTGGFWVYSSTLQQIIHYDADLNLIHESVNIGTIADFDFEPVYFLEKNDYVYLNIPEKGILVFDRFGAYYKTIPLKDIVSFQVVEESIIYYKDGKLFQYMPMSIDEVAIEIPDQEINFARIERTICFLKNGNKIYIYQMEV